MFFKKISVVLFLLLGLYGLINTPFTAQAHDFPGINHNTDFRFDSGKLLVTYTIKMYSYDFQPFYYSIDTNRDGTITPEESNTWLTKIQSKLYITTQNTDFRPQLISNFSDFTEENKSFYPAFSFDIDFGNVPISETFESVVFTNEYKIESIDPQDWNLNFRIEDSIAFDNLQYTNGTRIEGKWKTGNQGIVQNAANNSSQSCTFQQLCDFLKNPNYSVTSIIIVLSFAMLFGALHAFQPGHGKAIIGTYMAAIRGNLKDAFIISLATTISHTFVIVVIAIVYALTKEGFHLILPFVNFGITIPKLPFNVRLTSNVLKIVSGILVVILALRLVLKQLRAIVEAKLEEKYGKKEGTANHAKSASQPKTNLDQQTFSFWDRFNLVKKSRNYLIKKGYLVDHGDHVHVLPTERITLVESLWLGITSGLTPCFDALSILIISITLGLTWIGVWLLLAFSVGLALSLTIIGFILGKSFKMMGKLEKTKEVFLFLPIISSGLIALLGIWLAIEGYIAFINR